MKQKRQPKSKDRFVNMTEQVRNDLVSMIGSSNHLYGITGTICPTPQQ